jgi:hypothetical protein
MRQSENKELEKLVDKMMQETALDVPSFDFTSKVMSRIQVVKEGQVTTYKPLISTGTFIVVFGLIFAFCVYLFFNGEPSGQSSFPTINYSVLYKKSLWSGFSISKVTVYTVLASVAMFYIQIPFLKNHFDKRFQV